MQRFLAIVVALLGFALTARAQYFYGFSVESYKITSARPTSLRSVKGSVYTRISNTADTRTMRNITATVYRQGRKFAHGTCDPVTFFNGTFGYTLNGRVNLADGVSTWDAIKAAFSFRASDYTVDYVVDIHHADGTVDHVVRKGIPLERYLRKK